MTVLPIDIFCVLKSSVCLLSVWQRFDAVAFGLVRQRTGQCRPARGHPRTLLQRWKPRVSISSAKNAFHSRSVHEVMIHELLFDKHFNQLLWAQGKQSSMEGDAWVLSFLEAENRLLQVLIKINSLLLWKAIQKIVFEKMLQKMIYRLIVMNFNDYILVINWIGFSSDCLFRADVVKNVFQFWKHFAIVT